VERSFRGAIAAESVIMESIIKYAEIVIVPPFSHAGRVVATSGARPPLRAAAKSVVLGRKMECARFDFTF
jgi:hypothetical protein